MISSPSAQIVNAISESNFLTRKSDGVKVEAYGPTMGIATAIIAMGIAIHTALGPERKGSRFDAVPVIGTNELPTTATPSADEKSISAGSVEPNEKGAVEGHEDIEKK